MQTQKLTAENVSAFVAAMRRRLFDQNARVAINVAMYTDDWSEDLEVRMQNNRDGLRDKWFAILGLSDYGLGNLVIKP